ncbi:hypothetical protein I4U23_010901 [Adineta vaga]|nr:hypothetical protein I4U23_010901 [Adineta vaga]
MFINEKKPKHSFEPIIQLKTDVKLKALDFDTTDFDAHIAYTERTNAFIENKLTNMDTNLSCPFVAVPAEYEKSDREACTTRKKKLYITCTWDCPRMRIKIDTDCFEPTQQFLSEIDRILCLPIEEQYDQLEKLHSKYGHKIATEVVIGGQLFHTDVQDQDSVIDVLSHKNNLKVAFSASIKRIPITDELGMTIKGGFGGGRVKENRSQNEADDQTMNFTFKATGGDAVLCQEPGKWVATVPDYRNWRVIKIEKFEPLYKILDKEREEKIKLAIQHHNTVGFTSECSRNDSPNIIKLEITLAVDNIQLVRQISQVLSTTYPSIVKQSKEMHDDTVFLKSTKLCYYGATSKILNFIEIMEISTNSPPMILDIFLPHWKDLNDDAIELISQTLKFRNAKIETNIHISSYKKVLTKKDTVFYIESELENENAMKNVWKLFDQLESLTKVVSDATTYFFNHSDVLPIALKRNTTIQTLDLLFWILTDKQVTLLAQSLQVNKTLKNLHICLCFYSDDNSKYLSAITNILKNNRTLTKFHLQICCNNQVYNIMEGLTMNTTLTHLTLRISNMNYQMFEKLCQALRRNQSLEDLILNRCQISDDGAKLLDMFLKNNKTLKSCSVRSNSITNQGATILLDAIKNNQTLTTFDISHNKNMTNFELKQSRDGIKILCEPWLPLSQRPNKQN